MSVKVDSPHHGRCSARTCETRDGRRLPWHAFNAAPSAGYRWLTAQARPSGNDLPCSSWRPVPRLEPDATFDPPARA